MNEQLRRQIVREFPELVAGYHLPVMAEIVEITDSPEQSGVNDNYRPRYAATVKLINSQYEDTGIELTSVPVSITGAGNERGFFALPEEKTIVELAWLNGSPELPFVRSVLGYRKVLPTLAKGEMKWQQDEENYQSIDKAGNWNRTAEGKITDTATEYELKTLELLVTALNESKRILGDSVEDIDGKKQIEASAIHILSATVLNLITAGSINQAAAEHITRSAEKSITDHATQNITTTADENINQSAGKEFKAEAQTQIILKAPKLDLGDGTENLLDLVSQAVNLVNELATAAAATTVTITSPGNPSSPPINAPAITAVATKATALKTKVDGITA